MTAAFITALALPTLLFVALRADRRLAARPVLPMQWGLTGQPGWYAPRRVALGFVPVLAALILAPLALYDAGPVTALIALAFVAAQQLHLFLVART